MDEYTKKYEEDIRQFNSVVKRFGTLKENDIDGAFSLMKDTIQFFNRWSLIKYEVKKGLKRGEGAAFKERLEDMCRYLKEVETTSRIIWRLGKEELRSNREGY